MLLLNERAQGVELLFPEAAVFIEPPLRRDERISAETAVGDASFLGTLDQSGVFEYAQVSRNRRCGHIERLAEIADRALAAGEPFDHRSPRRVGKRGKHRIEMLVPRHRGTMISHADDRRPGDNVAFEAER